MVTNELIIPGNLDIPYVFNCHIWIKDFQRMVIATSTECISVDEKGNFIEIIKIPYWKGK